jgi:hypothetical protein
LGEAYIQEVLISYAAKLAEDDLDWLTVLSVPEDKADSDTVVERQEMGDAVAPSSSSL